MNRSAIILAGGSSKRFGRDKAAYHLGEKPLIRHVTDKIVEIVDKIVVVTNSIDQKKTLERLLNPKIEVVIDKYEGESALVGAYTGFGQVKSQYSLLLSCDTPFISQKIMTYLFSCSPNVNRKKLI